MTQKTDSTENRGNRPGSLSTRILIGVAAGIGCGLFFGEMCGSLQVFGRAFIDLMQMTVLPYITVALVNSIGRLTMADARRLAGRAGLVLILLWAIAALAIVVVPLSFPALHQGAFFSTSLLEVPPSIDLVGLYIPANPFHSLANNVVPAVVLFSICLGVALIGLERKDPLLEQLDVVLKALGRVNSFVVRLTPFGVFALAAAAAGTMSAAEMGRLHGYLLAYTVAAGLLAFWVLPMLISSLTPFRYGQVVGVCRDAVITAFATGKLFIVLPLIIEAGDRLMEEAGEAGEGSRVTGDTLVPLAYPFPSIGKLLGLLFLPFAAWFVGSPMLLRDYPSLLGTGLLTFFGSPVAAVPFLLDLFRLPADLFGLFVVSGVYTARLGDAVGAAHLFAFSILTICSLAGLLQVRWRRLAAATAATVVLGGVGLGSINVLLSRGGPDGSQSRKIAGMELYGATADHVVLDRPGPNPEPLEPGESRQARLRRRGAVRVGFHADRLPFSFVNGAGDLVGFDIDMAHRLARDLGVSIEFVPFEMETLARQLEEDHFDLAMAGLVRTFHSLTAARSASTPMDLTLAFVVPDHLRDEFARLDSIRELDDVVIGIVDEAAVSARFESFLPDARVVPLPSLRHFFEGESEGVTAVVTTAETGSAWTLFYPAFHVVLPEERLFRFPHVYPIGGGEEELLELVEHWAELSWMEGDGKMLFDYWILGRGAEEKRQRWSVIRDVLGWVE